jgi:hypothetical protein
MSWLKRAYTDANSIIQQVNGGALSPQSAALQLQGMDVCGAISNMVDSYGYLIQLSRLLRCGEMTTSPEAAPNEESFQNVNNEEAT